MLPTSDLIIKPFISQESWEDWLAKHHASEKGIWLQFYKKKSGKPTVTYARALEVALCYGWIDSQVKSLNEEAYIQKFTPRGSRSIWSKINVGHIARLIKEGKMKPAGLAAVTVAKKDGRWEKAYDSPKNMTIPEDFVKELSKHKRAETFFTTLTKTNRYAIAWRLQTAKKPETRARRMQAIIEMLEKGEKIHF